MSRKIQWTRVIVEGVVIVGSILLAFGIDAAWAESRTRAEEREVLLRVMDELESGGRPGNPGQRRAAVAAAEIVNLIEGLSDGAATVEVPDTILYRLMATPTFEPRTPALDGLRQSGRISIVRDAEVRAGIAAWETSVRNASEWELRARAFVDAQIIPALSERGDVGHVFRADRGFSEGYALLADGMTELRSDAELKALVSQRYANAARALVGLESVSRDVDSLLIAIQTFLER